MSSNSKSSTSSSSNSKAEKKYAKNQKKNKKQKKRKNRNAAKNGGADITSEYVATLNNPFEHKGCPLGWGCMVPTIVTTAYVKGSVTANADGSLAIALIPNPTNMVSIADGGVNVSFTTAAHLIPASDNVAIDANFSEGRVVSMGIRAYPNLPMTSAPGACYVGAVPGFQQGQALALTPNDLSGNPFMKQFRAYEGGTSVSRPIDTGSFEFNTKSVSAGTSWVAADDLPVSTPFITFIGIGNATVVYFEAIYNIECVSRTVHNANPISFNDNTPTSKLSDAWSSVESMWGAVKPYLSAAGRFGAQAAQVVQKWNSDGGFFHHDKKSQFPGTPFRLGGK